MGKQEKQLLQTLLESLEVIESTTLPLRLNSRFPSGRKTQIPKPLWKLPITIFTSDADELLSTAKEKSASLDLTGAGFIVLDTVPEGKRWNIIMGRLKASTGNCKMRGVLNGTGFDLSPANTAEKWLPPYLSHSYTSNQGDQIGATGGSNGADGAIEMQILYFEETMF